MVSARGVSLDGRRRDGSCADAQGSAKRTEEGQCCPREERNLTKILRCCGERSW